MTASQGAQGRQTGAGAPIIRNIPRGEHPHGNARTGVDDVFVCDEIGQVLGPVLFDPWQALHRGSGQPGQQWSGWQGRGPTNTSNAPSARNPPSPPRPAPRRPPPTPLADLWDADMVLIPALILRLRNFCADVPTGVSAPPDSELMEDFDDAVPDVDPHAAHPPSPSSRRSHRAADFEDCPPFLQTYDAVVRSDGPLGFVCRLAPAPPCKLQKTPRRARAAAHPPPATPPMRILAAH